MVVVELPEDILHKDRGESPDERDATQVKAAKQPALPSGARGISGRAREGRTQVCAHCYIPSSRAREVHPLWAVVPVQLVPVMDETKINRSLATTSTSTRFEQGERARCLLLVYRQPAAMPPPIIKVSLEEQQQTALIDKFVQGTRTKVTSSPGHSLGTPGAWYRAPGTLAS